MKKVLVGFLILIFVLGVGGCSSLEDAERFSRLYGRDTVDFWNEGRYVLNYVVSRWLLRFYPETNPPEGTAVQMESGTVVLEDVVGYAEIEDAHLIYFICSEKYTNIMQYAILDPYTDDLQIEQEVGGFSPEEQKIFTDTGRFRFKDDYLEESSSNGNGDQ